MPSGQARASGDAHGQASGVEVLETCDVDAVEVRGDAFSVERIDATHLAEVVSRGARVKAVLGEGVLPAEQSESAFVHLDHGGAPTLAQGAIANRKLRKVRVDLEAYRPAVA